MSSADALEGGHWALSVYGRTAQIDPVVNTASVSAIQIPTSGGGTTIFSQGNAEIEMEQESQQLLAQFSIRPNEQGLEYKLKAGAIRNFELEFSSGGDVNRLESLKDGFVWGVAVGKNITQGTIVSAAIAVELSYTGSVVKLDRFESANAVAPSSLRLEQDEFQGLVKVSRRWKAVEPFGGVKAMRTLTRLKDDASKEKLSGAVNGVSPFVGLQIELGRHEFLIVEGSFVDEESVSAGLKVQF